MDNLNDDDPDLPKEFDSREQWPECADVISHIRDQGGCSNSWAVATASGNVDLCVCFEFISFFVNHLSNSI